MKIGIYNRWLHTIGGGERYMLTMAEHLAQTHDVEVFTHQLVDKGDLERKLDVDLSRVHLRFVPELLEDELSEYTAQFDLFINATFHSLLPSRAPKGLLVVYFPVCLAFPFWRRLRRRLALLAKELMIIPEFVEGFYPPEHLGPTDFRWMSSRGRIRIPVPDRRPALRVELLLGRPLGAPAPGTDVVCSANGRHLKTIHVPSTDAAFAREELLLEDLRSGVAEIELRAASPVEVSPDLGRLGIAILDVRVHHVRYWPYYILFRQVLPRLGSRIAAVERNPPDLRRNLASYHAVCAISRYAQTWIDRYWDIPSLLLPPPAPVESLAPGPKKPHIVSVGRFFWGSHNKKHLEMIRVFKGLRRQGHLAGWELHLAGTRTPGAVHQAYLAKVEAAAAGAPVYVHTDIGFDALRRLYAESTIYWHACGYGQDEAREPEKFEHFGITTVEAMAAGCVPVVIAKGGQTEIVRHGVDGFLWHDLDELQRFTLQVAGDAARAARLAEQAVERSRDFGTEAFRRRLDEIITGL